MQQVPQVEEVPQVVTGIKVKVPGSMVGSVEMGGWFWMKTKLSHV